MKRLISILMLGVITALSVFGYTPSQEEIQMLFRVEDTVRTFSEEGEKEKLHEVRENVISYKKALHSAQYDFFFDHILLILERYIDKHEEKTKKQKEIEKVDNNVVAKAEVKDPSSQGRSNISADIISFYNRHKGGLTSDVPPSDLCTKYYNQIDEIAKEYNFPASLIIATRYREHTCIFKNPDNSRGNFQITTAYYKPGPITRKQFRQQVIDFIHFSKKKWTRYERFWKFDEIPVTLDYTHMDLLSVQKHSILYNGLRAGSTPQNNFYANQNFNQKASGRDGTVAMSLKIIGWALEKDGIENNVSKKEKIAPITKKSEVSQKKTCTLYFSVNLKKEDDSGEVKKTQTFLKKQGFFNHKVTGYYGDLTEAAVNAFQLYYKKDILDPGGYTEPTGNRYPSTRKKANQIWCNRK